MDQIYRGSHARRHRNRKPKPRQPAKTRPNHVVRGGWAHLASQQHSMCWGSGGQKKKPDSQHREDLTMWSKVAGRTAFFCNTQWSSGAQRDKTKNQTAIERRRKHRTLIHYHTKEGYCCEGGFGPPRGAASGRRLRGNALGGPAPGARGACPAPPRGEVPVASLGVRTCMPVGTRTIDYRRKRRYGAHPTP